MKIRGRAKPPVLGKNIVGADERHAACVFVEDPAGLIVADGAGVLRLFDPDGKGEVWRTEPLEAQHRAITALAVAEGGARVAVAMYKRVHLREIAGGAEAARIGLVAKSMPDADAAHAEALAIARRIASRRALRMPGKLTDG